MKKTMLALMATVGLAFGAKADGAVLNSTGFEYDTFGVDRNDSGEQAVPFMWSAATTNGSEATSLACAVTNYADAASKPTNLPDAFADAGDKYLAVDTSGEVLYRNVNVREGNSYELGDAQSIGDGLFFDSDVQFTATDSTGTPEPTVGDKLIVWLSGDDEGNTNLIVTATETYSLNKSQGPVNFTNNNAKISVKDSEWHRLTVAAANENDMTTFKVYVDGELVTAEGASDGKFKSLVGKGDSSSTYATLTAVGFMGTGAIDNLVWTTKDPFPAPVVDTVALTIDLTDDDAVFAGLAANAEVVDVLEPAPIVATVNDVITFVAKVPDGYTPTVEDYDLQKSAEKDEDDNYAYTFTVTVTQEMIENGLTLTITVTADEEPPPPSTVVTPTEEQIASGEIPVTAATTAIKVGGVDVPISAFNVVGTTATVKAPVVADSAAEKDDAFVIDDDSVTINVNPVVGLFYGVSAATDLDALARPVALTQYDGTNAAEIFTVSKPGDEKGFFKVYSDVKE